MDSGEVVELVTRSFPRKDGHVPNNICVYNLHKPTPPPFRASLLSGPLPLDS